VGTGKKPEVQGERTWGDTIKKTKTEGSEPGEKCLRIKEEEKRKQQKRGKLESEDLMHKGHRIKGK